MGEDFDFEPSGDERRLPQLAALFLSTSVA
jgi:hypothetical protein